MEQIFEELIVLKKTPNHHKPIPDQFFEQLMALDVREFAEFLKRRKVESEEQLNNLIQTQNEFK